MTRALTGPYFAYSDTWQLFITTGTMIVTFLTVFLIHTTQNRGSEIVAQTGRAAAQYQSARTGLVELDTEVGTRHVG